MYSADDGLGGGVLLQEPTEHKMNSELSSLNKGWGSLSISAHFRILNKEEQKNLLS